MDSTTPPTILTTPTTNKKQRDSPNISHLRKTTKAATILFHSEKMVAPLFYRVSENFMEIPKSWVVVG